MVRLEPARVMHSYPHELSGGMRQRVLIAMSLLLEPQVLILDEPTTALDILTQRSIVDVLHELRERLDFAMIFVSHDLALAAELADRVATMYAGRIVETGRRPRHLLPAPAPVHRGPDQRRAADRGDLPDLKSIPGGPPSLAALPRGARSTRAASTPRRTARRPIRQLRYRVGRRHEVACIHSDGCS